MKYIKRIVYLFAIAIGLMIIKVNAASLNVNISASSTRIVVGNTVTYTVTVSSSELLGSFRYGVTYDTNKLSLESGTLNAAPAFDGTKKSVTYTFKFRAKASGTANFNFNIYEAIDWNFNNFSYKGTTTKSITIISQAQLEASYSKNNNLSNLKVEGFDLSPSFNKNTTNYSLLLENDVREINITGSKEDNTASIDGLGKHQLVEGLNKINIKVTAQNGSTKTYVIEATVKELTPIVVKLEDKEYTVVRKKELIEKPNTNFDELEINIGEEEKIPAFENKATNTTLVGLKDTDGNIELYEYKDDNYKIYKEYEFDSIIITPAAIKDIPEGYIESKVTIGEDEITAYKSETNNDFYLINAINISNGEENLYQYNKKENTLQIFNKDILKKLDTLEEKNQNYTYVIIGLGALLIITYLVILINSIRKPKRRKVIVEEPNKEEKVDEVIEEPIIEEQPLEQQIEEEKVDEEVATKIVPNEQLEESKDIADVVDEIKALKTEKTKEINIKEIKKERKSSTRVKKNETFDEEIEQFNKKDGKIKEDISKSSKKKKK